MSARGKVLRDTSLGEGLISIGGQQYPFTLERHWRSDTAPRVGMAVDIEVNGDGVVQAIHSVPEGEIAKEEAARALHAVQSRGIALINDLTRRFGVPILVTWAAWLIATTLLDAIRVSVSSVNVASMTFWDLLTLANGSGNLLAVVNAASTGSGPSRGIYAFLFLLAAVGPALPQFWRRPEAHLGLCGPLAMMAVVCVALYMAARDAAKAMSGSLGQFGAAFSGPGTDGSRDAMNNMVNQVLDAFHAGAGTFIGLAAALYLAFVGLRKYLVTRS